MIFLNANDVTSVEWFDPYYRLFKKQIGELKLVHQGDWISNAYGDLIEKRDHAYVGNASPKIKAIRYAYDPLHCVTSISRGYGASDERTTHYGYTPISLKAFKIFTNGVILSYAYDPLGYLVAPEKG